MNSKLLLHVLHTVDRVQGRLRLSCRIPEDFILYFSCSGLLKESLLISSLYIFTLLMFLSYILIRKFGFSSVLIVSLYRSKALQ